MDAGDHGILVELAAIPLRDVERVTPGFRRPGNDTADIVALRAVYADTGGECQTKRRHEECPLLHSASPAVKITSGGMLRARRAMRQPSPGVVVHKGCAVRPSFDSRHATSGAPNRSRNAKL